MSEAFQSSLHQSESVDSSDYRILFDASIHLGQFRIDDEEARIRCKNSQVLISRKPLDSVTGVITFEENSRSDHVIWGLDRTVQDTFYKFMDTFHTEKNILRAPLSVEDAKLSIQLADEFRITISDALSCAVGITNKVDELHSLYPCFEDVTLRNALLERYGIEVLEPPLTDELSFAGKLEGYYQETLSSFRVNAIDIFERGKK